jgi:hypothetical protein
LSEPLTESAPLATLAEKHAAPQTPDSRIDHLVSAPLVGATTHTSRALRRVDRAMSQPLALVTVFAVALAVYAVRAIAWPLKIGRDLDEYLLAYVQLFDRGVLLPWSLLFRTPVTPLYAGGSLDLLGGALAEPLAAVLFAGSVMAWTAASRHFGPRVALAVALALLVYPGWGLMFHELSSETTFAAAFSLWAWLVVRAAFAPSTGRFVAVGAGIALLALVRPGNAVLLCFAVFPFVLPGTWRERMRWSIAVALAAALPLAGWSLHNGLRFDYWGLARGGNAIVPFYRAFITDHIISPDNGEGSRELATAMQRHLLTREPYRSYGVTLDELFEQGSFRVHEDLYLLSDQVFGWDDDYAILRQAGIEGVRSEPRTYARGVLGTVWDQLSKAYFRDIPGQAAAITASSEGQTVTVGGRELPRPTEGEPIPSGQVVWISRPDQSIRQVWDSPTKWHLAFDDPSDRPRLERIEREVDGLFANLPTRNGNAALALRLNQASRWYPRLWMWIVLGAVALVARRPRGTASLLGLTFSALAVVAVNALGLFADLHFVLPVAPTFVLLALAALLGGRSTASAGINGARRSGAAGRRVDQ